MTGAISFHPTVTLAAAGELPPLFTLLAVMLGGVVLVSLLLLRLQQSLLAGYFLCGVVIANSGILEMLGMHRSHEGLVQMSDFGVMLLMFTLGLEFSLSDLRYLRKLAFGGGGLQMTCCILLAGGGILFFTDASWRPAVVLGVALAMSSTAVSLKSYQDMGLSGSPGARFALAVAIFQDLFIIVFLLLLPLLLPLEADAEGSVSEKFLGLAGRSIAFVVLAIVSARWVTPWLLGAVTRTRNKELFTLTVVGNCIGLAFIGGLLDLGLPLGAFVAGLAVSESIYKHRIMAEVLPLKDLFLTLFFVSVGLMVDVEVALELWKPILLLTTAWMLTKAVLITGIAHLLSLAPRQSVLAGLGLCSAGEFSLLLLQKTGSVGMWSTEVQQILLASIALSMGLLPAVMRMSRPISDRLEAWGWGKARATLPEDAGLRERVKGLADHAIICGYGPVGQRLNEALQEAGIDTLIIELNADTVRQLQGSGQPVLFADASHEETWDLAALARARLVAFSFPLAPVTATALEHVQEQRPDIPTLARARFGSDVERLKRMGVTEVVHDELEAGRAVIEKAMVLHGEG